MGPSRGTRLSFVLTFSWTPSSGNAVCNSGASMAGQSLLVGGRKVSIVAAQIARWFTRFDIASAFSFRSL